MTITMRSPERVQYITAGLTKSVLLAHRSGYHEADKPIPRRGKADRLHARFIGAQALYHHAEPRIDDPPYQIETSEQAAEAEVIKLHAVGQVDKPAKVAALVNGQTVVSAVTGEARCDVVGHLREGKRDHDKVNPTGAQRQCADHQRKQRRREEGHRPLNETGSDAFGRKDADRIAANAEIGGVTKAHHAAVAHDQIEACRGQGKNHDPGEQRQREAVSAQRGVDREHQQTDDDQRRHDVSGVERRLHRRLAGNSPSGRTTRTIAITR
jgi:hypothetical protein